jgi:hypothetical protein
MPAITAAALCSVLVQPFAFALLVAVRMLAISGPATAPGTSDILFMVIGVLVVAVPHVLVLGIPVFLLMRKRGWLNACAVSLAGFLAGGAPLAVVSFPPLRNTSGITYEATWYGGYYTFVNNGVTTVYGWLSYFEGVVTFGLQGTVAALVFWKVWEWARTSDQRAPDQRAA